MELGNRFNFERHLDRGFSLSTQHSIYDRDYCKYPKDGNIKKLNATLTPKIP
jgi:hypothetical protein